MRKIIKYVFFLFILSSNYSCMTEKTDYKINYQPKDGDILFQDLECGPLCTAIKQVTFGVDSAEFSHIGLVHKIEGKWMVLEAISDGVKYTALYEFFKRSLDENGNPRIWVSRLSTEDKDLLTKAKEYSNKYIGLPYDDAFLMENNKYYCSELLYAIFKEANNNKAFFELEPMTFKDPNTHEFLSVWEDYYRELNMDIPEGKAGINPAGISRSDKIKIVQKLGKVSRK